MSKTIFVVEDDEGIRNGLQELLESAGYKVETANDGKEALDRLEASASLPALIILDLMLPVMDGYQFREKQEFNPRLASIPVVITTAGGDIESKALNLGAKGHLKKPFSLDDILNTVKRFTD